jgi:hypothetical protein
MYEYESYVTGEKFYSAAKLQYLKNPYDAQGLPVFYSAKQLVAFSEDEYKEAYSVLERILKEVE